MTSASVSGKGGRQSSAEKPLVFPHTRIEDEDALLQYYDIGKKLGEGTFGVVKECVHKETGEIWACKAINKEKAGGPGIKLLEREVAILKRVQHEHIIKLKEIFETSKKMYLIMEFCGGGELADALKEYGIFPEKDVKKIIERLSSAIAYLHKNDMVHRDLKLENILLSKNPQDKSDNIYIKVTDFGLSVVKSGVGVENLLMDFCGTPMYMAPEIIDNKTYGEKCDVWAMGVITFLLLTGQPPFRSKDEDELNNIIRTSNISEMLEDDPLAKDLSKEAKDCIAKMLTVDTAHRFTAREIAEHAWITGHDLTTMRPGNVLDMMRQWRTNPDLIPGADDSESEEDLHQNPHKTVSKKAVSDKKASQPQGSVANTSEKGIHGATSDGSTQQHVGFKLEPRSQEGNSTNPTPKKLKSSGLGVSKKTPPTGNSSNKQYNRSNKGNQSQNNNMTSSNNSSTMPAERHRHSLTPSATAVSSPVQPSKPVVNGVSSETYSKTKKKR